MKTLLLFLAVAIVAFSQPTTPLANVRMSGTNNVVIDAASLKFGTTTPGSISGAAGALTLTTQGTGGVGIGGAHTGASGLKVFGTTDATPGTLATGALQALGGASFTKVVNVGNYIFSGHASTAGQILVGSDGSGFYLVGGGTAQVLPITLGNASATVVNIPITTSSTTSTTGALKIGNGTASTNVGIGGGNINAGGSIAAGGTLTSTGIVGTVTNDAAAAGNVGALLSAQLAAASTTSLVTATGKTITSVSLTAGDWEVSGTVHFIPANTTVVASLIASVSATDNTQASVDSVGGYASIGAVYTSGGATMSATPIATRISLASTTTYYLVATGTFSISTCTAFGSIRARRVR